MGSRLSLRVQVALALALTLLVAGALGAVSGLALLRSAFARAERVELEVVASSLAGLARAACGSTAGLECLAGAAKAVAPPGIQPRVEPTAGAVGHQEASVDLGDGRRLVVAKARPGDAAAGAWRSGVASLWIAYLGLAALLAFVVGFIVLERMVARPVDRLAAVADRIGRLELQAPAGEGGPMLGRLGVAFERMARSLQEEQARVAAQIALLKAVNAQLADARGSLVRSEKLATVGRLAAGLAHEIGNPLGAILGYLDLVRAKASAPEVVEYVGRIDGEVARIDRTVRELLDFSRPGTPSLGPVRLRGVVDGAVRLASVQKRLKGVTFRVEVPDGMAGIADAQRLTQVLLNLFLNAGDALGGKGEIAVAALEGVELAAGRRASDPATVLAVELTVSDTGPGIPEADLARVFDPFFTTKPPGEGTGLGLSICHQIMESFGGAIRATNRPEGGAAFILTLREAHPGAGAAPTR